MVFTSEFLQCVFNSSELMSTQVRWSDCLHGLLHHFTPSWTDLGTWGDIHCSQFITIRQGWGHSSFSWQPLCVSKSGIIAKPCFDSIDLSLIRGHCACNGKQIHVHHHGISCVTLKNCMHNCVDPDHQKIWPFGDVTRPGQQFLAGWTGHRTEIWFRIPSRLSWHSDNQWDH